MNIPSGNGGIIFRAVNSLESSMPNSAAKIRSGGTRHFNGKIGIVSAISDTAIEVKFSEPSAPIKVEPYVWKNLK